MNNKIKYGVVGAGHLGNFHIQQLLKIDNVFLVGVFDLDEKKSQALSIQHNVKFFNSLSVLLELCDAVSVCTPASTHFKVASLALKNNCHIFIEKPITNNLIDALQLIKINEKIKKIIQVGHIERFNSAFVDFIKSNPSPLFIEAHRLSPFGERGLDVAVVLDLMIHDIDLILSVVKSDIVSLHASGSCVLSDFFDLANARIEFKNGCVANITASRISNKQMRKMRVFEKQSYGVLDFQNQSFNRWVLDKTKNIKKSAGASSPVNALYEELKSFVLCITDNISVSINEKEATKALRVALKIQKIIEKK